MRTRTLAGMTLLGVGACFSALAYGPGQAHSRGADPAAAAQDSTAQDAPADTPQEADAQAKVKPHRPSRTPPLQHVTEAADVESEHVIREKSANWIDDYNSKNAQAFAEQFLAKGEYELDTGEVLIGRDAIQQYFAASFTENSDLKARLNDSTVRLVSLHVAIQEGSFSLVGSSAEDELTVPYVAVWATVEGQWSLAAFRELVPDTSKKPTTAHEHLEQLSWLLGDWVDESEDSTVRTTCRWSEDGNFLIQEFTVKVAGEEVMSGTQRIGWDASTQELRAWLFDSLGGHGDSVWNWDGERWVVRATDVRDDGERAASINFLIPVDENSFRWEASHRMAGDDPLPDVSVLIVRQAPTPELLPAQDTSDQ